MNHNFYQLNCNMEHRYKFNIFKVDNFCSQLDVWRVQAVVWMMS